MKKLKNKINEFIEDLGINESPVNEDVYGENDVCPCCGLRKANKKAWRELNGGQGTNLCWTTYDNHPKLSLSIKEANIILNLLNGEKR